MEKNLIIKNKCKSFIILNDKKEILKYDSSHNHPEKEYDVSLSIMEHKIKDGIEKKFNSLCYLNNLFPTIPSYYELIDKLNELEHLPYYDYQRKIRGIWKIKKRAINKANEISVLIERYKNIETKLIDTKCDRNNTINLWFDCLTDLNNII
ncbi:hypothetical protein U3516DRAFT_791786 [Neocallimastix sp. 'constans']